MAEIKSKKMKMKKQPVQETQSGPDVYFREGEEEEEEEEERPKKVNMSGQQVLTLANQNLGALAIPKRRELILNVSLHFILY